MSGTRCRRAWIVVDLGFGDAGKGLLTDYLVRRTGARVVVRFNGGAQAGHNVMTADGRHHTFAQFGAGTFVPGVRTFLSRHVLLHPGALLVEGEALRRIGITDAFERIGVSESARVITPFHQAANRLRELARGEGRHGTCGVGVGETVRDALEHPQDTVLAGELREVTALRPKLERIRERKRAELNSELGSHSPTVGEAASEWAIFERPDAIDTWLEQLAALRALELVVPDAALDRWSRNASDVVFEGAQGVLLDEVHGFHPFTTWSRCTPANARELAAELAGDFEPVRVGVLRSYGVRHGAGPFPSELRDPPFRVSEHNVENFWQGPVRYGWFDAVLARYALEASGGVDALALTHLDAVSRMARASVCVGYGLDVREEDRELVDGGAGPGFVQRLVSVASPTLERQERLARLLARARPVLEQVPPDEALYIGRIERLLERGVDAVSRGPRAVDLELRSPTFGAR